MMAWANFDEEYGVNVRNPKRKVERRESFSRGSNARLAYYKERNPHYFNGGRTVAESQSIIELWEAVIWQAANDIRSSDEKIAALMDKKNRQHGRLKKDDAERLLNARVTKQNAINFFNSDNLVSICSMIGYDAQYIRDNMVNMIKKDNNLYQKNRRFKSKGITKPNAKSNQ